MGNTVFSENLNTFRDIFFDLSLTGYFGFGILDLNCVNKQISNALRKRCFNFVHLVYDDLHNGKEALINGYEILQNGDLRQPGLCGQLQRIAYHRHLNNNNCADLYMDKLFLPRNALFILTNRNTDIRKFCNKREQYLRNRKFSINELAESYILLHQLYEEPPQFLDREHQYYFDRCVFYKHYVPAKILSNMIGVHFSQKIVDKDGNPVDIREFVRSVINLL